MPAYSIYEDLMFEYQITDSIKDTYRVFKVIDASANVDLRDLSENTGFYIPLNTDKDKVKLTTKDNDITFEIKRDGVDINGNNIFLEIRFICLKINIYLKFNYLKL